MPTMHIALAGNPNAGKTTLFNALTGDNQHVGNWPGKTVQRKSGVFTYKDYNIHVIDLPGVYSLSSFSPEEEITRDYLVSEDYDLAVNVVDTSNLERNLYLTVQIAEIGVPMMLQTAALKGKGLRALKEALINFHKNHKAQPNEVFA
ncbi:MAG: FeoB small GTPase domain-containing protein [Anaerolineales bacterium]